MAYSDDRILPTVRRLSATAQPITVSEISEESGVPLSTVKRRLAVLIGAGIIRREGSGRRWGSTYQVMANDPTSS